MRWSMRFRLMQVCVGAFATSCVLAAPAARAFIVEDRDTAGKYSVPKFDLEEQSRNFRSGGETSAGSGGKQEFNTPLGKGTLEIGTQQGPTYFGGHGFGSSPGSRNTRQDYDRMFQPR